MKQIYFKNAPEWREWLEANHEASNGIWMIFYKKGTGKPTIDYNSAVEEALCWGWIDSIIKKIDNEKYTRKFTPRKNDSLWSELNKRRVEKVIKEGKMTPAGLAKVNYAKKRGRWKTGNIHKASFEMPEEFRKALAKNKKAEEFFNRLAPSYKRQFIGWVSGAKMTDTRAKRIEESIFLLEKGEKLGMK